MRIIDAPQGSQTWLAIRSQHFTASEAPAMLGLSKYKTRQELLREKATGLTEEIDANKQRLFAAGHASEAAARPLVETLLQEDLFPTTGAAEIDGLPLLASFDGLDMDNTLVWENKLASDKVEAMIASGDLDETYWPQVEQQLMVSGASRALFTACDGEKITAQLWYESKLGRRQQIIAGWHQFKADMEGYQHTEAAPEVTAAPVMQLPALSIQVNGSISLIDNLEVFGRKLTDFIDSLPAKPETDQQFADADAAVKTLKTAEEALDAAESSALAQTASIDQMRRTVGLYRDQARTARLMLDKLVKTRKESIRIEIAQKAKEDFVTFVGNLNVQIGKPYLVSPAPDFAGAMKGMKKVDSCRDAVDTLMAQAKIAANEAAGKIIINMQSLHDLAKDHAFLFADAQQLVTSKTTEDLILTIKVRIHEHKMAEEKRLMEEREKMRIEEEKKAEDKVRAEAEDKRKADERERIRQEEAAKLLEAQKPAPVTAVIPEPATLPPALRPTPSQEDVEVVAAAAMTDGELRQECNRMLWTLNQPELGQVHQFMKAYFTAGKRLAAAIETPNVELRPRRKSAASRLER